MKRTKTSQKTVVVTKAIGNLIGALLSGFNQIRLIPVTAVNDLNCPTRFR